MTDIQLKEGLILKTDSMIHKLYHTKVMLEIRDIAVKHLIADDTKDVI